MEPASIDWGLSLDQTLLIVALILVLVDLFTVPDTLTHVSYVIVAVVVARLFDIHILYRIIVGICTWAVIVACHYLFWKSFVESIVNRFIAPDRFKEGGRGLVGAEARVAEIDGKKMLRVRGDLWQCKNISEFQDGDTVKVVAEKDGLLSAEPIERSQ